MAIEILDIYWWMVWENDNKCNSAFSQRPKNSKGCWGWKMARKITRAWLLIWWFVDELEFTGPIKNPFSQPLAIYGGWVFVASRKYKPNNIFGRGMSVWYVPVHTTGQFRPKLLFYTIQVQQGNKNKRLINNRLGRPFFLTKSHGAERNLSTCSLRVQGSTSNHSQKNDKFDSLSPTV